VPRDTRSPEVALECRWCHPCPHSQPCLSGHLRHQQLHRWRRRLRRRSRWSCRQPLEVLSLAEPLRCQPLPSAPTSLRRSTSNRHRYPQPVGECCRPLPLEPFRPCPSSFQRHSRYRRKKSTLGPRARPTQPEPSQSPRSINVPFHQTPVRFMHGGRQPIGPNRVRCQLASRVATVRARARASRAGRSDRSRSFLPEPIRQSASFNPTQQRARQIRI
jgi:hypothetical protein